MLNKFEEIQMLKVSPVTRQKANGAPLRGENDVAGLRFGKLAFAEMASTLFWKRT